MNVAKYGFCATAEATHGGAGEFSKGGKFSVWPAKKGLYKCLSSNGRSAIPCVYTPRPGFPDLEPPTDSPPYARCEPKGCSKPENTIYTDGPLVGRGYTRGVGTQNGCAPVDDAQNCPLGADKDGDSTCCKGQWRNDFCSPKGPQGRKRAIGPDQWRRDYPFKKPYNDPLDEFPHLTAQNDLGWLTHDDDLGRGCAWSGHNVPAAQVLFSQDQFDWYTDKCFGGSGEMWRVPFLSDFDLPTTTTTTTTTTLPAVSTTASAEDSANACSNSVTLTLNAPTYSNLGGQGPDLDQPEGILYPDAGVIDGVPVDVMVSAEGEYHPKKASANGVKGSLGVINMWCNSQAIVYITIVDKGGAPVEAAGMALTVLDVDEGKKTKGRSTVRVCGAEGVFPSDPTELYVGKEGGCFAVTSTTPGTGKDNPSSTSDLTAVQKSKIATFYFGAGSSVRVVVRFGRGKGGRGFMWALEPVVPCLAAPVAASVTESPAVSAVTTELPAAAAVTTESPGAAAVTTQASQGWASA